VVPWPPPVGGAVEVSGGFPAAVVGACTVRRRVRASQAGLRGDGNACLDWAEQIFYAQDMSEHSAIQWTDATWNPITGCTQISPGCDHCLAPDTLVLYADMSWRPIGDAQVGDALVGFDEHAAPDGFRKIRPAVVEAVVWSRRPARRLITERAEVITTGNHRWLRSKSANWPTTDLLRVGKPLRQIGVTPLLPESQDYRAGYLAGMTLGDGTMRYQPGQRSDKLGWPQAYWRVALKDEEALGRLVAYLATFGVPAAVRPFGHGMQKVEVRSVGKLAVIHHLVHEERPTADWRRGFLAGFFDAEGDHGWVRDLCNRCQAAGVAFFLKQWGGRTPKAGGRTLDSRTWDEMPNITALGNSSCGNAHESSREQLDLGLI
jgi:hypothetical protein